MRIKLEFIANPEEKKKKKRNVVKFSIYESWLKGFAGADNKTQLMTQLENPDSLSWTFEQAFEAARRHPEFSGFNHIAGGYLRKTFLRTEETPKTSRIPKGEVVWEYIGNLAMKDARTVIRKSDYRTNVIIKVNHDMHTLELIDEHGRFVTYEIFGAYPENSKGE